MSLVFDSSAMLALLRDEKGADAVSDLLSDADVPKLAHAVNLCEVFYDVLRTGGEADAEAGIAALQREGIEERDDMEEAFWRDVAALVAKYRNGGKRLALGDAFGVALARRLNAAFVTADHGELDALAAVGAARFRLQTLIAARHTSRYGEVSRKTFRLCELRPVL